MKVTREFYVPKHMSKIPSIEGTELYTLPSLKADGMFPACGFSGKKAKWDFYFRFKTLESRDAYITKWEDSIKAHAKRILDRKEEKKIARKEMDVSVVKVGDVYHWTGGYNCTRNAYVQVIGVAGKNKFRVAKLDKTQIDGDWMNGNVGPVLGTNNGELILSARVGYNKDIILRDTTSGYQDNYYKWNGKPNWENCD